MCDYCDSEHPTSCCAKFNLLRMAYGGEPMPTSPLEMGVKPIPSIPVDFLGLQSQDLRKAKSRSEKVDKMLQKYEKD